MAFSLDFTRRHCQPEIMDQPDLPREQHWQALRGLARINSWSGSARILWGPIKALARRNGSAPLRLLDVATGGGDVPLRLWHKARRAGLPLEVEGCDVNPQAVAFAQHQAEQRGAPVRFFVWNALADPLPAGYDIVTSEPLFLHHLAEDQAMALLQRMGRLATRLVLVNDLLRSRTGFLLAWLGTRVLSLSPVVHVDGPRSVEAAFTREEIGPWLLGPDWREQQFTGAGRSDFCYPGSDLLAGSNRP